MVWAAVCTQRSTVASGRTCTQSRSRPWCLKKPSQLPCLSTAFLTVGAWQGGRAGGRAVTGRRRCGGGGGDGRQQQRQLGSAVGDRSHQTGRIPDQHFHGPSCSCEKEQSSRGSQTQAACRPCRHAHSRSTLSSAGHSGHSCLPATSTKTLLGQFSLYSVNWRFSNALHWPIIAFVQQTAASQCARRNATLFQPPEPFSSHCSACSSCAMSAASCWHQMHRDRGAFCVLPVPPPLPPPPPPPPLEMAVACLTRPSCTVYCAAGWLDKHIFPGGL